MTIAKYAEHLEVSEAAFHDITKSIADVVKTRKGL
jgi:hypothetical protein